MMLALPPHIEPTYVDLTDIERQEEKRLEAYRVLSEMADMFHEIAREPIREIRIKYE